MKITPALRARVLREERTRIGRLGGAARALRLTPARRAQIASQAAQKRWAATPKQTP